MLSSLIERYWWIPLLRGLAAILFGIIALAMPGITLASLILIFGVWLLFDGVFTIFHAFGGRKETSRWWMMLLEGLIAAALGIYALRAPGLAAITLLFYIAGWAILSGIIRIALAFTLRREIHGEWWMILGGFASVLFGLIMIARPGAGAPTRSNPSTMVFASAAFAQSVEFPPFEMPDRPQDANNFQPRVGFAYQLSDRTVIRGGTGLYYNDILNTNVLWPQSPLTIAVIRVNNDGRPDFASNPFNGPLPTYEQALQRFCNVNNRPGCLLRDLQEQAPIPDYAHVTHSWQTSIGVQHQFGTRAAVDINYVNIRSRDEKSIQDNVNITFDPATGDPYPYSNVARRAFPTYGVVGMIPHTGQSDYHGLQTSVTKRMSDHWQGTLTYTLAGIWDQDPQPISGFTEVPFPVAKDLGGERSLAEGDQRHRLVFNGIWEVGKGFQVSGIYFYGSGQRSQVVCGCDARGLQIASVDRMRLDGTIIPRQSFVGEPIHRVEMRVQQRVPLGGRASIAGFAEVFNLFNHDNFGVYNLTETSPTFGQPIASPNLSYAARTVQLGFRLQF